MRNVKFQQQVLEDLIWIEEKTQTSDTHLRKISGRKEMTWLSIVCTTSEDISTDPILSNVALYSSARLLPMVELSLPTISLVLIKKICLSD